MGKERQLAEGGDQNQGLENRWDALSRQAKDAIAVLAVADQRTGVPPEYLKRMEVEEATVQELVEAGFVKIRKRREIAREFVNVNRDIFEVADDEIPPSPNLSTGSLWTEYQAELRVSQGSGDDESRYMLREEVLDFVSSKVDEEE